MPPVTRPVCISCALLATTLAELQKPGKRGSEGMLVWLGKPEDDRILVTKVYVPEQEAGPDYFWISPASMRALMAELRAGRLQIAAQVHTHPHEAFHSPADDHWAIVRHEGALSLVLPDFGMRTTLDTFVADTAVFRLNTEDDWIEVPPALLNRHYRILP